MPMPRHRPGRRKRAIVSALCAYGVPHTEIAKYLNIDRKTLEKYYPEELRIAHLKRNIQVGNFLYTAASGAALEQGASYADCVRAAMFWAKTQMGFRETNRQEITNPDGSLTPAIVERIVIDPQRPKN